MYGANPLRAMSVISSSSATPYRAPLPLVSITTASRRWSASVRVAPINTGRSYPSTSILISVGTFTPTRSSSVRTATSTAGFRLAFAEHMVHGVQIGGESKRSRRVETGRPARRSRCQTAR